MTWAMPNWGGGTDNVSFALNKWDRMGQNGTEWDRMGQNGTEWDRMGSAKEPDRTDISSGWSIIDVPGNFRPPASADNGRYWIANCVRREMKLAREVQRKDRADMASKMIFLKLKILLLSETSDERRQTDFGRSSSPLPI
jgi:hypothetical protein